MRSITISPSHSYTLLANREKKNMLKTRISPNLRKIFDENKKNIEHEFSPKDYIFACMHAWKTDHTIKE